MTIQMILTLLLISTPFIWSNDNIRCFPPFNYKENQKCLKFCSDGNLVQQGTFDCKSMTDSSCEKFSGFREFDTNDYLFCSRSQGGESNSDDVSTITGCSEGKIPNYMTGICESPDEIEKQSFFEFGAFNHEKTAFFHLKLLEHLINQKFVSSSTDRRFLYFKDLISANCEIIDLKERKCIKKQKCIDGNKNIFVNHCVETCSAGEVSLNNQCTSKTSSDVNIYTDSATPGYARVIINCWQKTNQNKACGVCDANQVSLDFQTGLQYCSYKQGNYIYISNELDQLTEFHECQASMQGCYQICTEDKYLNNQRSQLQFGIRLVDCSANLNTKFGIFKIKSDDCPFYLEKQVDQTICSKRCSKLFKLAFRAGQKLECVKCKRLMIGGEGCSDHCEINQIFDGNKCVPNDKGDYSFQYDSTTQKFECKFPRMLSLDDSSCIDQCGSGQIPKQIGTTQEYKCEIKGSSIPLPKTGFLLSSDETRNVQDCIFIHEITCQSKCKKRTETLEAVCKKTTKQIIELIEDKMDQLVEEYKGIHFMQYELKSFLKEGFEFDQIKTDFLSLIKLTIKFSENYAKFVIDGGEQLLLENESKTITIKVASLPDDGNSKFSNEINFNTSKNASAKIPMIQTEKQQFDVLSLSHFDKHFQICKTQDDCYDFKFIEIKNLNDGNSSQKYKVVFNLGENEPKQNSEESKYHCFIDSRILNAEIKGNEGNQSIECEGPNQVGYFYGPDFGNQNPTFKIAPESIKQSPPENSTPNTPKSNLTIILIVVGVVVVGLIIAFVVYMTIKRKKSQNQNV